MKTRKLIKEVLLVANAVALVAVALLALFVFGAVLFDWPLAKYITPIEVVNRDIVIKVVPLPQPDKPKRDSRLSVCVDENGKRVSCT